MPYFRDVVRGQQLENVDITIHCELAVFGWLMRWLESRSADAAPPELSADVVVSVLSSADFLRMEPLVDECVAFIGADLSAVAGRPGVACLSDRLMARLAALFDHRSVEALSEHERLRSRLYCQLTARLCGARPRPAGAHQRTAAQLFRCADCGRLLLPEVAAYIPCAARNLAVCADGRVAYRHRRDTDWQLGAHVAQLRRQLRSWRLVYWRLWAAVNFLWCARCEAPFAAAYLAGCRFHPEPARYGTLGRSASTPLGHHPCCGGTAVQFDPLRLRGSAGCLLRDHLVQPAPDAALRADDGVYEDLLEHRSLAVEPPPAAGAEGAVEGGGDAAPLRAQTELQLVPSGVSGGGDCGLLPATLRPREGEAAAAATPQRSISLDSADFTASDDEEEAPPPPAVWTPAASTRHNQDAQRHRETGELRRLADQLSGRQAGWRARRGLAAAGSFLVIERELRASAEPPASDGRHRRGRRK
ncbi:uncharacterized protein KIAA1841 homolog [Amphibalanus amphitrite]|uniref:uncharacterized protein KIAA1841 homolog n=1 Tax=Amphibalanus amphitrite TaxID=1232801 RepID=UPI001C90ECE6|nr:uncharacterized protein KIAA1841 homolog [Amphibalanus amphitrite]